MMYGYRESKWDMLLFVDKCTGASSGRLPLFFFIHFWFWYFLTFGKSYRSFIYLHCLIVLLIFMEIFQADSESTGRDDADQLHVYHISYIIYSISHIIHHISYIMYHISFIIYHVMSCWKSSDYKAGSCHRKTSDSFTHFPSLHMARCSMWLRLPKKVIKVFQYEQPWVNSEIWWSNSIHENIENRGNTNRKQPFIIHIPSLPQPPSPIHTGFACATLLWLKRWPPPSSIWCFPSCLSF